MATDIRKLIAEKAAAAGMDPNHALTIASIETGGKFDPNAVSPTKHKGLFQFGDAEWKQYGGGKDIFDPEANIDAFVKYHADIKDSLKAALGREPTPQEMYLGWQQGAGGAAKLLTNSAKRAGDLVPSENLRVNNVSPDITGGAVASLWNDTYNTHNKQITGVDTLANITPSQYVPTERDWQMYQKPADAPPAAAPYVPQSNPGLLSERNPYASTLKEGMGLLAAGTPGQQMPALGRLSPYEPGQRFGLPGPGRRGLLDMG